MFVEIATTAPAPSFIFGDYPAIELKSRPNFSHKTRRTVGEKLLEALATLAEGRAALIRHSVQPWSSVTFSGARHEIALRFTGTEAGDIGENFIALLPDHEFAIPGQLVADANITAVCQQISPEQILDITCEILLLEDA